MRLHCALRLLAAALIGPLAVSAFPAAAFQTSAVQRNLLASPSCPLHRASLQQRSDLTLSRLRRARVSPLRGGEANSDGEETEGKEGGGMSRKSIGQLELILVALMYGSLTVALRVLYSFDGPPMASAVSFTRGLLAAACFIPPLLSAPSNPNARAPSSGKRFWLAAAELAFWNLGAQGLLNVGLLFTEASRASFLTQTSVVLTPLVAIAGGDSVGPSVIGGSLLALVGVVLLSQAESGVAVAAAAGAGSVWGVRGGDLFCLCGALSWSLYIVRLSRFMAQGFDSTRLQAWKTVMLGGLYGVWCLYDASRLAAAGLPLSALWPGIGYPLAWAVLFYSALGPGAIADVMQANGQEKVSSSEANVILSAEPLWAALFGLLLLGERLPLLAAVGGALILAASLLATGVFAAPPPSSSSSDNDKPKA